MFMLCSNTGSSTVDCQIRVVTNVIFVPTLSLYYLLGITVRHGHAALHSSHLEKQILKLNNTSGFHVLCVAYKFYGIKIYVILF